MFSNVQKILLGNLTEVGTRIKTVSFLQNISNPTTTHKRKKRQFLQSRTIVVFFRQIATQIYATSASTNALEYLIDQGKVNDEVDDQSNERK